MATTGDVVFLYYIKRYQNHTVSGPETMIHTEPWAHCTVASLIYCIYIFSDI